jgi:uncharacterized repeat protein (TIGR04042 family)
MPEMLFRIRWPDGAIEQCYSPSLVIKDYLEVGATYDLAEFMRRSRIALIAASDRVREKYGFACSRAMAQLARLDAAAGRFERTPDGHVTIISFEE